MTFFEIAYEHHAAHDVAKKGHNLMGILSVCFVFSLIICFKVTFETMQLYTFYYQLILSI